MMFSHPFFLLIGVEPVIADMAADFVYISIPGHFLLNIANCFTRFFAGQREVRFGLLNNIVSSLFHIPCAYYLAETLNLKLVGIAIANNINFLNKLLVMWLCLRFSKYYDNVVSLRDPDCLKRWIP